MTKPSWSRHTKDKAQPRSVSCIHRYNVRVGSYSKLAHRAVESDLMQESGHRDLMRLYAAIGRPERALRQYHELERILKAELGAAPSAATCELAERLKQALVETGAWKKKTQPAASIETLAPGETNKPRGARGRRSDSPDDEVEGQKIRKRATPSPTAQYPAPNLPPQFTRFFGREAEIDRLKELLCGEVQATIHEPAPSLLTQRDMRLVTLT